MNHDSRMLVYIGTLTLLVSCVGTAYGLFFFGLGPGMDLNGTAIPPAWIIAAGVIIASVNGLASNLVAENIREILAGLHPFLRAAIPWSVFLATLGLILLFALMK